MGLSCKELSVATESFKAEHMKRILDRYAEIYSLVINLDHETLGPLIFQDVDDCDNYPPIGKDYLPFDINVAVRLRNERNQTLSHLAVHASAYRDDFSALTETLRILQKAYRVESIYDHSLSNSDRLDYEFIPFGMGITDNYGHSVEAAAFELASQFDLWDTLYPAVLRAKEHDNLHMDKLTSANEELERDFEEHEINGATAGMFWDYKKPSPKRL